MELGWRGDGDDGSRVGMVLLGEEVMMVLVGLSGEDWKTDRWAYLRIIGLVASNIPPRPVSADSHRQMHVRLQHLCTRTSTRRTKGIYGKGYSIFVIVSSSATVIVLRINQLSD